MAAQTLRVFISSPGDVGQERLIATRVLERLKGEFAGYATLEPVLWEHEPLRATAHFQEQIVAPSQTDVVLCILWSRLGTRLPTEKFSRDDGTHYASGTEWEFEDAAKAFLERGAPDLMVYRKTSEAFTTLGDEQALLERLQQKKLLDAFIERWFGSAQSTFKAAFHTFQTPDQFEDLVENHLRSLIRARLPQHVVEDGGARAILWHKGSPYRGLEAFDMEHAPVFFGRTRAIGELKDALSRRAAQGCAFLLVFGMSGSGKSSLVRAGVLPTIAQPGVVEGIGLWRWAIFRPSDAPHDVFQGLAQALLRENALPELELESEDLAALLREAPERCMALLRAALKRAAESAAEKENLLEAPAARLALVVDQMEELFTLEGVDASERERFAALLSALARGGLVWIIGTMRSDFYPRCLEVPELVALKEGPGQYDLLPPAFAEIRQIIVQPTRAAGLSFEVDPKTGEHLDDVLHEAAAHSPEALPLLEFTLDELYQERTEAGVLTFAAYQKLGGLEGALARRAEDAFQALPASAQAALPAVLRCLVTVEGEEGRVARRRMALDEMAATPERKTLVEALIQARLLVTDREAGGQAVVSVAHEALLRHWPRVQEWLAEDREFLLTRERVAHAASEWQQSEKSSDYLLSEGRPLADALDLLAHRRAELDAALVDYIEASRRKWAKRRRRKNLTVFGVAAAFFVVVTGFGVFSYGQWQRAEKQKNLALESIKSWSHDIPDALQDVPGTLPVLKKIFEKNLGALDQVLQLNANSPAAMREKALNYESAGDTWRVLGDTKLALDSYRKSHAIFEDLAAKGDARAQLDLARSYTALGDTWRDRSDYQKALDAYQKKLAITEELAKGTPNSDVTRDLAISHERIGDIHLRLGDQQKAMASYEKSHAIFAKLATPGAEPKIRRDLAVSYEKIGDARMQMGLQSGTPGDAQNALGAYAESLKIRVALSRQKPSVEAKRDVALSYIRIGDAKLPMGDTRGAIEAYEKGHAILLDLAQDKFSLRAQRDLSTSHERLGELWLGIGDYARAAAAFRSGVATATELLAKDAGNVLMRQYLADVYSYLAWTELLRRQPAEAVAAARQGLEIDPDRVSIRVNLAHAYLFNNQFEKATITYLRNVDAKLEDGTPFKKMVFDDFKQFHAKGLNHPDMAKIERLLIEASK